MRILVTANKMLRAISDVAYAHGDYEKEMEQAALKKEARNKNNKEDNAHGTKS